MTELNITEAGSVQFPMVRHAAEIGWTPIPPDSSLQKRGGEAGMLFRDELEGALGRFNPWMTDDAIRAVVERLEAIPPTIEGNREMLAWLRGERQWYDEAEKRSRPVQLIDFDAPSTNIFHVTWEWKLKPPARKGNRADVMFVVNGVPVAIVEHKHPKDADAIERGVTQLKRYEKETPELMGTAQLFNVTHLLDYWYGVTWNIARRSMARWKERPEESYRFAVQSFFEPTDFLRTLRDWILFYVEDGETRKSVLRQHQRRAVDRIVERCAEPTKQRGLIWHTQGSGKTFTLLTAARLILERKDQFRTPTVVVVVDRTELEGQLKGWVERLLGEMQQQDIAVWRADSKAELRDMLKTDKRGLILSMIHKFEGLEKDANTRDTVYVFIDEAHRSVAKELGTYLMAAVPNATIIGFTGTPIDQTAYGEGTFKIFGVDDKLGYLDKYPIAESIKDETTLPIRHTMAPSEMTVPAERLDREFFALAELEGVTDVDELNKVLDRSYRPAHLPHRRRPHRKSCRIRRQAFPRERGTAPLQGVPRRREPRSLCQVQAGARQAAAPRMDYAGLYRECRRHRQPPARGGVPAFAGPRGRYAPDVQESGCESEDPHRHRQTTHRLRRAAPLLPVSRQAHARPRAPASHRAREPPLRHK